MIIIFLPLPEVEVEGAGVGTVLAGGGGGTTVVSSFTRDRVAFFSEPPYDDTYRQEQHIFYFNISQASATNRGRHWEMLLRLFPRSRFFDNLLGLFRRCWHSVSNRHR